MAHKSGVGIMKRIVGFIRLNLAVILTVSLLANVALGIVSFVLQPLWRAAAVTSAVAAHEVKSEIEERNAIAKARSKEKAKARLKRIATAVPLLGLGAATYFEYGDYQEWLEDNPDGDFKLYSTQVLNETQQIADEVLEELPDIGNFDTAKLLARMQVVLDGAERLID